MSHCSKAHAGDDRGFGHSSHTHDCTPTCAPHDGDASGGHATAWWVHALINNMWQAHDSSSMTVTLSSSMYLGLQGALYVSQLGGRKPQSNDMHCWMYVEHSPLLLHWEMALQREGVGWQGGQGEVVELWRRVTFQEYHIAWM